MFVLFEENNQVGEYNYLWPLHIEGKDKDDCNHKIHTYMDSMYGGYEEGEDIHRKYYLNNRDVFVDNVQYFETREELVEAIMKRTEPA